MLGNATRLEEKPILSPLQDVQAISGRLENLEFKVQALHRFYDDVDIHVDILKHT